MDRFELVEKLVKSTGVSYEDAKIALESSGWDLLDAAVWLEKNGRIESKSSHFTTNPEQQQEQQKQQKEQQQKEAPRYADTTGNSGNHMFRTIISKAKEILMDNELVICKQSGEIFLETPIWLAVVLLIVAFWPTVVVLILVFILGFRFRLHGPDLGSDKVNSVLNRAENAIGGMVDKLKNQHSGSQYRNSYDNGQRNYKSYDASNGSGSSSDDVIDYKDPHQEG